MLCVKLENTSLAGVGGIQPTTFVAGLATSPSSILGQAYVEVNYGSPDTFFCFEKDGGATQMKSLVSVSAAYLATSPVTYNLTVSCTKLVDSPQLIKPRKASATLKQDE